MKKKLLTTKRDMTEPARTFDWRVDRTNDFSGCEYIYDAAGRLIAIDYAPKHRVNRVDR